jgi:hypothetical protein
LLGGGGERIATLKPGSKRRPCLKKEKEKNWGRMLRKGVYRKIVEISNKKEFIKIKPEN